MISAIAVIRKIGRVVRRQAPAATALGVAGLLCAAVPAAAADAGAPGGLPFSSADVGWIILAVAALIVLSSLLQTVARRRRRRPLHAVVPRRTDL